MATNILVVDDSQTVRAVIRKTLSMSGIPIGDLFEASNGLEALEQLELHGVDVIFSDINMPEMGGLELVDVLQSSEVLKSIPVVIVSTEGSSTRIEELKRKGIRAYLRKPFTPEQFRNVLEDVVGCYQ